MAFPPSKLAGIRPLDGTHEGNRGQQLQLRPNEQRELLKLENGSVSGEPLAVALSLSTLGKPTARDPIRGGSWIHPLPRARVFWGAGTSRTFADVDFGDGVGITVSAESLMIKAYYEVRRAPWSEEEEGDHSCLPVYQVQATVGYGCYCCRATFTEIAFVEEPEGRCLIEIPPFARSLTVLPINSASVAAHLLGHAGAFTVENVIATPLSNANQKNDVSQIPIPNGMRWVAIENTNESDPAAAFVVFSLAI